MTDHTRSVTSCVLVMLVFVMALALLIPETSAQTQCTVDCGSHGHCDTSRGRCVCEAQYNGMDCSIFDAPLTSGSAISNSIGPNSWQYYHIDVNAPDSLLINLDIDGEFSRLDLYTQLSSYPTKSNYLTKGPEHSVADPTSDKIQETLFLTNLDGQCFIGLRSAGQSVSYTITATVSQTSCECNNHGVCVYSNDCDCYDGYSGDDCEIEDPLMQLNQWYTQQTVGPWKWNYYEVEVPMGAISLGLFMEMTSSHGDPDLYVRKNKVPDLLHYDMANTTGISTHTLYLNDVEAGGKYFVGVHGYGLNLFTSEYRIKATVRMPSDGSQCANDCSLHGNCLSSKCSCYSGYDGEICEEYVFEMDIDTAYSGLVMPGVWNYFHFHDTTNNNLVVSVVEQGDDSEDCDVFLRRSARPDFFHYDMVDMTPYQGTELVIDQVEDVDYYVGIFGYAICHYTLRYSESTQCDCTADSHGHCEGTSAKCECDSGWTGEYCDRQIVQLQNNVVRKDSVGNNEWNYYEITVDSSLFAVAVSEENTSGMVWVYLSTSGAFPTPGNYDYMDSSYSPHELHVTYPTAQLVTYRIGVYGAPFADDHGSKLSYTISVYGTPF